MKISSRFASTTALLNHRNIAQPCNCCSDLTLSSSTHSPLRRGQGMITKVMNDGKVCAVSWQVRPHEEHVSFLCVASTHPTVARTTRLFLTNDLMILGLCAVLPHREMGQMGAAAGNGLVSAGVCWGKRPNKLSSQIVDGFASGERRHAEECCCGQLHSFLGVCCAAEVWSRSRCFLRRVFASSNAEADGPDRACVG